MLFGGLLGTAIFSHAFKFIRQVTFVLFMPWETDLKKRYTTPHSEIENRPYSPLLGIGRHHPYVGRLPQ